MTALTARDRLWEKLESHRPAIELAHPPADLNHNCDGVVTLAGEVAVELDRPLEPGDVLWAVLKFRRGRREMPAYTARHRCRLRPRK